MLQPPICGIDDSSHQPQRRAAAASPGHRSAKCSAWPPDSARTRGRCDGAGPKPRTPGPRPDRNWPKWLVKPWFRHVETMVETMVNHRFTSQSGDLSIKMNGIEGMWRFQYGDFWVSLFKIPKSPLVSVLNWFNFGWFGGRPILGNLHLSIINMNLTHQQVVKVKGLLCILEESIRIWTVEIFHVESQYHPPGPLFRPWPTLPRFEKGQFLSRDGFHVTLACKFHRNDNVKSTGWWLSPTPLENMISSVGIILPNIWKNKSHVPNHQPVNVSSLWLFLRSDTEQQLEWLDII